VLYFVTFFETCYDSLDDATARVPDTVAAQKARSQELHARGALLVSGAFLNNKEEKLRTMAALTCREGAEEYARGDPFVLNIPFSTWYIHERANMFA
jgi:uncharacterized protein